MQKWNLRDKLGKKHLDYKKLTLKKVNGQTCLKSQRSTLRRVNCKKSKSTWRWCQQMMQANEVSKWRGRMTSANDAIRADVVGWCQQASLGTWRCVRARLSAWRSVTYRGGEWKRVEIQSRCVVAHGGAWLSTQISWAAHEDSFGYDTSTNE